VFSDLDGTLLNLHDYDSRISSAGVQKLVNARIPLVFCSSKTHAEQRYYQQLLGVSDPCIVENGSAIFVSRRYFQHDLVASDYHLQQQGNFVVLELARPVHQVRQALQAAKRHLNLTFACYDDLTLADIQRLTQLDDNAAQRARERDYSETILEANMDAAQWQALRQYLAERGFACVQGSRFATVSDASSDKGKAVKVLLEHFQRQSHNLISVAIGDGVNDVPMLEATDHAYLVKRPDNTWADIDVTNLNRVDNIGPIGWSQVIEALLVARA
jgi:mannosyl-3-phosphoglycerate phosphatase family protein